jgi:hypothetical protein
LLFRQQNANGNVSRGIAAYIESVESRIQLGVVSALDLEARTIWIVDAHRDDGKRFIVRADEKLSAFVELERQVLTVTFYLDSMVATQHSQ